MENVNKKRARENEHDKCDVKRIREDLLDNLVYSDPGPDLEQDKDQTGDSNLASVMKSFEEEITVDLHADVVDLTLDSGESQPELGYLLEASDDELGLPPSTASSNYEVVTEENEFVPDSTGFGEFWRFDDDFSSFELPEVTVGGESSYNNSEYVALDDSLFDYPDVYFESSDFLWRTETQPAV